MFEFELPDIGEGVVEGEIVQWLVKPGDVVDVDQPVVEVMTDKATVVISSPRAGTVRETRGNEGDLVQVHTVIALIEESADAGSDVEPSATAPAESAGRESSAQRAARSEEPQSTAGPTQARTLAAPATRRLARELGVDIETLVGTGPGGRVLSDDVRRAANEKADQAEVESTRAPKVSASSPPEHRSRPSFPDGGSEEVRIPVRGLRRRIWENMARSTSSASRFTFVEELDATELVAVRARFNHHLEDEQLTFLPFIVKAVVAALRSFPSLNGHVDEERLEFVQLARHHIGVAASSDRGLTVPVVRDAGRLSLLELSREIRRLGDAVKQGTIEPADLGGSTFTVTSLGRDGGLFATPVINHPEVAILGVHRLRKEPRVVDGQDNLQVRAVMNLSLSFDHRWVDGHVGAAFTYRVIRLLGDPDRLFLEMP
ncbi:MAG: dihydrolipoamide acetyltransferase family protein [Myxococcota bacterium]